MRLSPWVPFDISESPFALFSKIQVNSENLVFSASREPSGVSSIWPAVLLKFRWRVRARGTSWGPTDTENRKFSELTKCHSGMKNWSKWLSCKASMWMWSGIHQYWTRVWRTWVWCSDSKVLNLRIFPKCDFLYIPLVHFVISEWHLICSKNLRFSASRGPRGDSLGPPSRIWVKLLGTLNGSPWCRKPKVFRANLSF